ncbi:MAG: hypothetical protein S4CHLAM7_08900 [Chlamydiae bacterium]|nr:hypothetical protein [Chlamydiota bacterium]
MPFTIDGDWIPKNSSEKISKKIVVHEQKKKGKDVTLVQNVNLGEQELKDLVRFLKNKCHCGGTFKNGVVELQGKKKEAVLNALKEFPNSNLNL